MRLRSYLLCVAAVGFVPGFTAAIVAVGTVREGEREAALRALRETVRATALLIDRGVQGSLGELKVLGNSENLRVGKLRSFHAQATALGHGPNVWTSLFDATGALVLDTSRDFGVAAATELAQPCVAQALADRRPVMTDLIADAATGKLFTMLCVPAVAAPEKYVVTQSFTLDHWRDTALELQGRSRWVVAVIDHGGRFIARSKHTDAMLGRQARPELVAAAAASHEGLIRHKTLEGVDSYDAFTHSELTGWNVAVAAPVETIEASAWQAVSLLLAGLATALIAATAAAILLGRKFISEIASASAAAQALGRAIQPEPAPADLDEVNALNLALVEAGDVLARERSAREAAQAERQQLLELEMAARQAAQQQNIAKDNFMAMLGHELRNPLAGIMGATALLERNGDDEVQRKRYLGIIDRQNKHLTRIVNELLEVSRAWSGKIVLDLGLFDLGECVSHSVDALRATEQAREHSIVVDAQQVWVRADLVRVEQIVNNLVANALKFSLGGSEIHVRVSAEAGQAVIEVSDVGVGMSQALLGNIFEPFVQGPGVPGRVASGLGIGLALVRQLVQLHGGQVIARSAGAGLGSTLVVTLPQAAAPAPDAPADAAEAGAGAIAAVTSSGARVLLGEDNRDARLTMAEALRGLGYVVDDVADGVLAVTTAAATRPDVVVLDIGLPGSDGRVVAARIHHLPGLEHVTQIALTGFGLESDTSTLSPALFDAHLVKPVSPQALARCIEEQLKVRRLST